MKTKITLIQDHKEILSCTVNREMNPILSMSNEEILELISGLDYIGNLPKEEDLEEIISHTSYFNIHVDDAIYEVLTMPREKITI